MNEKITDNDNSGSSNASNLMNWVVPSTSVNQRMRRIEEILDSIPYFYGSMLDDDNLQQRILIESGDCLLISCLKEKDKINPESNWYLIVLESNGIISKVRITYRDRNLKIWNNRSITLHQYLQQNSLKTIERPWKIIPDQLTKKMPNIENHIYPIDNEIFLLGKLSRKTLNIDQKRWIPVIELNITDCNINELKCLIAEAEKRRRFGSIRIWRLWSICEYDSGNVSLILEDIIYGSLAEFVRIDLRPQNQLCKFAMQIIDGLRNLEKYGFIHYRLSIDVCLLTYNFNVKIAIYGLTANELFPQNIDYNDIDQCRWLPPECLPNSDSISGSSYGISGMIYSFGIILWSLYHGGALPFEDEPANNIRNRQYRIQNPLFIEPELVPVEIRNVISSCCSEIITSRGRLKHIKAYLQKYSA